MPRPKKVAVVLIILVMIVAFVTYESVELDRSSTESVLNGGFEEGLKNWERAYPSALGGVGVVQTTARSGSHSLRLLGPGLGYLQTLDQRSIIPRTQLSFCTLLNVTAGENEPQALFHLYFLPTLNGPTYYVDITVTHANSEDLAIFFEPNPGIDGGGIYLRFNREPLNRWINISVDVSNLMDRYFPDFFDPRVKGILLESAEGGRVYFDDISLNTTNLDPHWQFVFSAWNFIEYSTTGKTATQLLAIGSAIVTTGFWICHRWRAWVQ